MFDSLKTGFQTYLIQILVGLIIFLIGIIIALSIDLYFTGESRDKYMSQVKAITLSSEKDKARYKRDLESFENAQKAIVTFYETKRKDVDNFTRRENETDCEAAYRFFDSHRS